MQPEDDPLLDTKQLAERTNTGKSSWDKRRMSGDTPPYLKLGRKVLYRWSDVQRWLAEQSRRSTSDPGPRSSTPSTEARA